MIQNEIIYILALSGGKDSTFLLLELIRRGYPLHKAVFFDTGWEFPAMYEHIEQCKKICYENGIEFVTLHPETSFDYQMLEYEYTKRNGTKQKGMSWCGGRYRWGTGQKISVMDKYVSQFDNVVVYIGIAADETERLEKERAAYKRFPLAEWGIVEAECLQGCYDAGFDWGGMYEHLDRLSCMYCRNKNINELRNIRKFYPDVWENLKERQTMTEHPLKSNMCFGSVFDLEKRFAFEDERTAAGLSITNRDFYKQLKVRLGNETI